MKTAILVLSIFFTSALSFSNHAAAADPAKINWSVIPVSTVGLFYPGQSSYEWLISEGHKGAAKEVRHGDSCTTCHDEQDGGEQALGEKLVQSGRLEPTPVLGKNGFIALKVQAAYDARNAYLRFQWKTANPYPGTEHPYLRFDGRQWNTYGYPKLDKLVQEGKQPALYEDRLSLVIDDGKVPGFASQGCWLTCHDGQRDMPRLLAREEAHTNALMAAIRKNDIRKYLPSTRRDPANWKTGKSAHDMAKLKAEGGFLDLIQWRAHRTHPTGMADDGYILESRTADAGKSMFGSNADPATDAPKYMWNAKKTGYHAITAGQIRNGDHFLIRDRNAVPFDATLPWKEGDLLPSYYLNYLSGKGAKGSVADNRSIAHWKDGIWTVVIVRPLNLVNDDDKALKSGGVYNVGFAVHDDNITTRGHQVSFAKTLGFGASKKVDIRAVRLK